MIPVAFDYAAPTTLDEALAALAEAGDDGKLLAGGQSLIPVLKLRMAAPSVLVDLGRIDSLRGIREDGDALVIGAMTTHHQVANDPLVARFAGLITQAARVIADPQVRHRGTFGGALVHADPAADLPAPTLALDAEFVVVGPGGTRTIAAADFFEDLFTTAVGEDEILTEVRIPKREGWGTHHEKFTRTAQQWPVVGVSVAVRVQDGAIAEARIGMANMASVPVRATATEAALAGIAVGTDVATEAAIGAAVAGVAEGTNPPDDANGDPAYRRHLAEVLTRKAVVAAMMGAAG
ncbi:FAD binding domain-containing protein [Microbacterium terrisoli]|jgi:carbon-monoxide dehydrogenase medium subunit|uniref:FAD binding domain-containing protein n=1 Tax=Microbacterium terrisoli TaxID=3242192 RepID=UPI002805A066|nr:xanthine dehydrogenase family protein subunit M [Microbacterium protaetiae]